MKKKVTRAYSYILQVGITMIVPIALMGFVGVLFSKWFKSDLGFIICIIVGILAGFRNCYMLFKEELKTQEKEDKNIQLTDEDYKEEEELKKIYEETRRNKDAK